jgi:hypothetical protein
MPADSNKKSHRSNVVYGTAIFFAAFLLFQMELIIAKYILPWFGGSASVWTTCMLVFQMLLLAGYLYAHLLSRRLPLMWQTRVHILLVAISFIAMVGLAFLWPSPFTPGAEWKPEGAGNPVFQIINLLAISIGMPFFILAATSPLLQAWRGRNAGSSPYRLYAISNVGSLLGLLTYPFILEPTLTLKHQAWLWFFGYAVFTAVCIASALSTRHTDNIVVRKTPKARNKPKEQDLRPGMGVRVLWLLLAATACSMFLATTNMLCQEIAVVPFLWVLPLSLYLISFIFCFDSSRWYKRIIFHPLYLVSIVLVLTAGTASILEQIGYYSLGLFAVAMILHGELVRLKPSSRYLTSFYLFVSAGGALGGVFVAIVAPLTFPAFWEFQICLFGCGILLAIALFRDRDSWLHRGSPWLPLFIIAGVAIAFEASLRLLPAAQYNALSDALPDKVYFYFIFGAAGLIAIWSKTSKGGFKHHRLLTKGYTFLAMLLVSGACVLHAQLQVAASVAHFRSFFSVFTLQRAEDVLTLSHGQTKHGWQIQNGHHHKWPTAYFAKNSGIGLFLGNHSKRKMSDSDPESDLRVGIIGLGAGTLAAYGRSQDLYRFYEIDPEIVRIAQGSQAMFTYLDDSDAEIEVVLGDGRLSLEREAAQGDLGRFDVLVLDAFSSDSIPTHLLTREAMEVYLQHLRGDDAVIACHITNRLLDLTPVVLGLSREFNMSCVVVVTKKSDTAIGPTTTVPSRWVFLSRDPKALTTPQFIGRAMRPSDEVPSILWTDNYSNLYQIVNAWM